MSLLALRRRLRIVYRPDPAPPAPPPPRDRSQLLRDLEVSVPAPERIVGWDRAAGAQRFNRT
jgi:hypothetical protein